MNAMADSRFLIIFSIVPATRERLAEIMPRIKEVLGQLSDANELVFRSPAGDSFGYVLRSGGAARDIVSTFQGPGRQRVTTDLGRSDMPFLTNADGILVVQIATDFYATQGFTRVGTWLQRH